LIEKNTCVATMEFSRCARAGAPAKDRNSGLSKLNSVSRLESRRRGRRCSRRAGCPDGRGHRRVRRLPE